MAHSHRHARLDVKGVGHFGVAVGMQAAEVWSRLDSPIIYVTSGLPDAARPARCCPTATQEELRADFQAHAERTTNGRPTGR